MRRGRPPDLGSALARAGLSDAQIEYFRFRRAGRDRHGRRVPATAADRRPQRSRRWLWRRRSAAAALAGLFFRSRRAPTYPVTSEDARCQAKLNSAMGALRISPRARRSSSWRRRKRQLLRRAWNS